MKYAYYNEFDPKAAGWLRELIKGGLIAPGIVDERSIADVRPEELKDFTQCHFFAGIGGGVMHSDSQDGQTTDLSGQEVHPANHSVSQENAKPKQMPDTSGRCSSISSASVSLQSSLENKLRQRLGRAGSMIYKMIWKPKTTPRGRSYYQLAASAHRTSDNASGSLPNGWATPNTMDHMALRCPNALLKQATNARRGRAFPANLREQVIPWCQEIYATGKIPIGSTVEMISGGQLNPAHSRWLMGYPKEWDSCGVTAMQSCRSSRRSS